jgi:hypothetical protein
MQQRFVSLILLVVAHGFFSEVAVCEKVESKGRTTYNEASFFPFPHGFSFVGGQNWVSLLLFTVFTIWTWHPMETDLWAH